MNDNKVMQKSELVSIIESLKEIKNPTIKNCNLHQLQKYLKNSTPDDFNLANNPERLKEINDLFWVLSLLGRASPFKNELQRSLSETDFQNISELSTCCLHFLNDFIQKFKENSFEIPSFLFVPVILICSANNKKFLWSSTASISKAKTLIENCCQILKLSALSEILFKVKINSKSLAYEVLKELKPFLTRDNWKKNPCSCQIFKFIFLEITHTHLEDLFSDVFPPILLFLDDYEIDNQLLGIECIHHLICNVLPTTLKQNGYANVIFSAIKRLTYSREPILIVPLFTCMLSLLAVLEKDPNSASRTQKYSLHDEVFQELLINAEMESRLEVRRAYSNLIYLYIDSLGISVLKHMKRTLRVIFEYLSTYEGLDEITRKNILKALNILINVSWPRIHCHCEPIIKCLVRLLYDIGMENEPERLSNDVKTEIRNNCISCLLQLKLAAGEKFQVITAPILDLDIDVDVVNILTDILNEKLKLEQ